MSIAICGTKVRPSPLSTICTNVCSEVPIIEAPARSSGRLQAAERMILQAMTVLEQEQPTPRRFLPAWTRSPVGRLVAREGEEQAIVEQLGRIDVAAGEGDREQDAVELAADGALRKPPGRSPRAGTGAAWATRARATAGAWRGGGRGRWSEPTPRRSSPVNGCRSARARSAKLLGLAQDEQRLVGDARAQWREPDHALGPLDQHRAEQLLEIADASR